MGLFNRKKKDLEMIKALRPTSKATLKMQCLFATKGDIDEARKLYDFFAEDMASLPDYDPAPVTWIDNTKDAANGIMAWLKENQTTLAQGYDFIRTVIAKRGELPEITAAAPPSPLPPINE